MTHEASGRRNRLAGETSPYLLQHADNPVDWHAWGEEALALARAADKPILLSIGYSACHWCHVMAHESFEHAATARLMNDLFVNIKVDREERPDLDKIYQIALQMLTHRNGGWPLTMFLAPDSLAPFYGGTYFPREPRYGMPAFTEVLERVAAYYHEQRADLQAQSAELLQAFRAMDERAPRDDEPAATALDMARHQLRHSFDERHGGFGGAPKFPHPPHLVRLLRHAAAAARRGAPDEQARQMALYTLARMAGGGIYDQLGGGFCRYAVDAEWMIPHFEKMLYDNAQLLPLYAEAWQSGGDERFARIAAETAGWVMGEMQSPQGGYYSSLDADSEGEEGKFYVWTPQQVRELLDAEEYAVFAPRFGLDRAANFEHHAWHLHCFEDIDAIAAARGIDVAAAERLIDGARDKLLHARAARIRPGLDDKVLGAWNALMIRGMAIAARILDRPDFLASARRALDFVRGELWRDGRLLVTWKDGRAQLDAYLDDYAFLLDATLEMLQSEWRDQDLAFAVALADALIGRFEDADAGGFFFTSHEHETLIHRPKPYGDDALPAGNAVAARALQRLGHLLGETRYTDAAARAIEAAWPQLAELPYAHCAMLDALEEYLEPPQIVVLRGEAAEARRWLRLCHADHAPARMAFAIPAGSAVPPGLLAERRAPERGVLAYVCSGTRCGLPLSSEEALKETLQ
jgi:uncharacterized protein YyaL (SSP411 family)